MPGARLADRYSVIRSMRHTEHVHDAAIGMSLSGQSAAASACTGLVRTLVSISSPISTKAEHALRTERSVIRLPPSHPELDRKIHL